MDSKAETLTKYQRYYRRHKEEISKRRKQRDREYYQENKELIKQRCKLYSSSEAGKISQRKRTIRKRDSVRWYWDFRGRIRSMFKVNPPEATADMFKITILRRMFQHIDSFELIKLSGIYKEMLKTEDKKTLTHIARIIWNDKQAVLSMA